MSLQASPDKVSANSHVICKMQFYSFGHFFMTAVFLIVILLIPWCFWTSPISLPDLISGWTAALNGLISGQKIGDNKRLTDGALSTRSNRNFEAFLYQRLFTERRAGHNVDDHFVVPVYAPLSVAGKAASGLTPSEAQASLTLAREMLARGKSERAMKIFQHALALDPAHPDILNEYGEFLEHKQADIVQAERLYSRALVASPSHTRALDNYRRTAPAVSQIDQAHLLRIDQKRDALLHVPETHPGLRKLMEENYYRHLYHATALEGNTFSLAQTRSFVESRMVVTGKSIMEHNEILGMEAALAFLNSSLINRIGAITVQDILDIHHRVLGYVDPFGAGVFRTTQVFVSDYIPPEASRVEALVSAFIAWLNSNEALNLHPIEMAALAHYKLVHIHPFYDGNGRTSRLLMNLVLMQAGYPPTIVPVEHRTEYYEHLKTANDGDVRPFIRFIARCTERTIDEYLWATVENVNRTFPEISINSDLSRTIQLPSNDVS